MITVQTCSEPADRFLMNIQFESIQLGIPQLPSEAGLILLTGTAHSINAANEDQWVGTVKNE